MNELRAWRDARKISQAALAEKLVTSQPRLSMIENGDEKISLGLSARIFKETGLCVGKLKGATPKQARTIAEMASAA